MRRNGAMTVVDIGFRSEDLSKTSPSDFAGKICSSFLKNDISCWFDPVSETSFTLYYPVYAEEKVAELLLPFNIAIDLTERKKAQEEAKSKKSFWKFWTK